jgi:hypothetical protein
MLPWSHVNPTHAGDPIQKPAPKKERNSQRSPNCAQQIFIPNSIHN